MGWEGKCGRESERMRRARGARIIGQADALAASCGGPAAVERLFPLTRPMPFPPGNSRA